MNIPDNLKYTEEHEWIKVDGNTGTIGVTDYAQNELGDVIHVEIEEDAEFEKGDNIGTIEAVKTVSDVFAPCAGKVTEVNPNNTDNAEVINQDPYGEGWLVKIEIKDPSELDELMDAAAYKEHIGE